MDSTTHWYAVIFALIAIYAVLDGFDLGIGILHRFAPQRQRLLIMRAIGPFYDGNEVWLIIFEQALMAIFPVAYGAIFSGFYLPVLILTASLVLRVCALEFRHNSQDVNWIFVWDWSFCVASLTAALSFGAMLGYLALGLPLSCEGELIEVQMNWWRVLPLITAWLVALVFALHGTSYLLCKVRGDFQFKVRRWGFFLWALCPFLVLTAGKVALMEAPHLGKNWSNPTWLVMLLIASGPITWLIHFVALYKLRPVGAFLCSGALIVWGIAISATSLFPNLVLATNDANLSITAFNAISSPLSRTYLARALTIGIPLVLSYTATIYWLLRAPVNDEMIDYYS